MIRLHVMGDENRPPNAAHFAEALRAIANDIEWGGLSGDAIVEAWDGRSDEVSLGLPIIVNRNRAGDPMTGPDVRALTRFVTWSLTWDDK